MFMKEDMEQKRQEFMKSRNELERKKLEFEKKLADEFPFMQRGANAEEQAANGGIRDLFGAYGCDVGPGWLAVLRGLCAEITAAYERAGLPVDIVVDQVKEKFGKLRFYYHPVGYDPGIQAIDSLDGVGLRAKPGNSELHREVAKIVKKWEAQSALVCERCGEPGSLRNDIGYLSQTLCDACYTPIKQKLDEQRLKRSDKDEQ